MIKKQELALKRSETFKADLINELFQKPSETFTEHLNLADNERIIFSGRFGIGKTTFINHYFEKNIDKYNVIHLYPVNYSVLQNEDIFTYLKYDILIDLIIDKDVTLKSATKYGIKDTLPFFITYKWYSILTLLPLVSEKLGGRNVYELMKGLGTLKHEFDIFRKGKDAEAELADPFFQLMHKTEGSLYETNDITDIIKNELANLKGSKENVLIIDDLDRIDPAHIFRILNVFSAHFDDRNVTPDNETSNKFGFDKVILVCDIDNIRNIYATMYGGSTDFNGYVDKFFSTEIYRYDNKENLYSVVSNAIDHILVSSGQIKFADMRHSFTTILNQIFIILILQNKINLRTLFRYRGKDINLENYPVHIQGRRAGLNPTLIAIATLIKIFGDKQVFKHVINGLDSFVLDDPHYLINHLGDLFVLLNYNSFKESNATSRINVDYNGNEYFVRVDRNIRGSISSYLDLTEEEEIPDTLFFDLFKEVVSKID